MPLILYYLNQVAYFVDISEHGWVLWNLYHLMELLESQRIKCCLLILGAADTATDLLNLNCLHIYLSLLSNYPLNTFSTEIPRTLATSSGLRSSESAFTVAFTRL